MNLVAYLQDNKYKHELEEAANYLNSILSGQSIHHIRKILLNDLDEMRKDMMNQAQEMLERSGFKGVYAYDGIDSYNFGHGIHEMGTARMGRDPKTSVLNSNNQLHSVKNVYVTDGSCMTSGGNQNPSITYMALTARAVTHAVSELKKMNI
mgnify:CR=1 FL=1